MKNLISRHFMVLVYDTSSECALQIYEVSLKYTAIVIERTGFCDGQTDARGKTICLPTLCLIFLHGRTRA